MAASPRERSESSSGHGRRAPVVGVTPSLDPGRTIRRGTDYLYLNRRYVQALAAAGAIPIVLPPEAPPAACLDLCDALVLSGGGDLPARFDGGSLEPGSTPGPAEAVERLQRERQLLQAFADEGRPVLGVCFGMQLMNLHFGGSLLTDLSRRERTEVPHVDHGGQARSAPHPICVDPASKFFRGWAPPAAVSSCHGQAVDELAPGFRRVAWAPDGVTEAIERGPLVGVEWHPESDESGRDVYRRFVSLLQRQGRAAPVRA